jgi:hypothetical protein
MRTTRSRRRVDRVTDPRASGRIPVAGFVPTAQEDGRTSAPRRKTFRKLPEAVIGPRLFRHELLQLLTADQPRVDVALRIRDRDFR